MKNKNIYLQFKNSKTKVNQLGFTLIELLVVISIISLLASIIIVQTNSARIKARDAKRAADLRELATGIELYYEDKGAYPISQCLGNTWVYSSWDSPIFKTSPVCYTFNGTPVGTISQELAPYVHSTGDPRNKGGITGYDYFASDNQHFCLMIYGTPENMNNFDPSLVNHTWCSSVDANGQCVGVNTIGYNSNGGSNCP